MPQRPDAQPSTAEYRKLTYAVLASLLLHALLLSLTFGGEGLWPGLGFPWQDRRVQAPDLRVVIVAPETVVAEPTVIPIERPLPRESLSPPAPSPSTPLVVGAPRPASRALDVAANAPPRAEAESAPTALAQNAAQGTLAMEPPASEPPAPVAPPPPMAIEPDRTSVALALSAPPTPMVANVPSIAIQESTHATPTPMTAAVPSVAIQESPGSPTAPALPRITIQESTKAPSTPMTAAVPSIAIDAPSTPAATAMPNVAIQESTNAPSTPMTATVPSIAINEPSTPAATAMPDIAIPESTKAPSTPMTAAVPSIAINAPSTPAVTAMPDIAVPESTKAPSTPMTANVPSIAIQKRASASPPATTATIPRVATEESPVPARGAERAQPLVEEAQRKEAERQPTERQEAERKLTERKEAERQEMERKEAERTEAAARREAALRAIGRQLDEEAARRERASRELPSSSSARRYRLWGQSDANAELVRYAVVWARKIEMNMTFDAVRDAAKQPHRNPVVIVAVRSDGSVESVSFEVSSGVPALDEAIRRVVASQLPYERFPPGLASEYDVVEIRRTWQFDVSIRLY